MKTTLDLTANIIDVRDIIARIEELENEVPESEAQKWDNCDEFATLTAIMEDLEGAGSDEQWRGDWYPSTLIRESHFRDYAEELAIDCGMVNDQVSWPNNCIDWGYAARELKHDYTTTEVDGVTYFFR